ncbi:MAG: recombinase family protein [Thermosynechococcaceae cyanobacterium MS004]|nr:recombinase family protein [Thermosynechococcaceae cyanobacterium MS004]
MTGQGEKDLLAWERLEQGRQAKAAQGGYVGYGSPAFGQQSVEGELVENPDECQVIELIRRHHKSGKSLQKIADWLNREGYCTKRGQPWQRISVKRVLDRLYGKPSRVGAVCAREGHHLNPLELAKNVQSTQCSETPITPKS